MFSESVVGLTINPSKCIIIPTRSVCSIAVVDLIHNWLYKPIPRWSALQIAGCGEYLGFWVGPASSSLQMV
eukprot:7675846-Karenia_brevis.AAC.1